MCSNCELTKTGFRYKNTQDFENQLFMIINHIHFILNIYNLYTKWIFFRPYAQDFIILPYFRAIIRKKSLK